MDPRKRAREDSGWSALCYLLAVLGAACNSPANAGPPEASTEPVAAAAARGGDPKMLDKPRTMGGPTLNQALGARRSVRTYGRRALSQSEISQLLWAAQGVTSPDGWRTAPSAGGTQPLELHLLTADGVFRYEPGAHRLDQLAQDDRRARLADAALGQRFVQEAPAVFVIAGLISRTSWKYGERAERYVAIEAGAAGQNLLLQAAALELGAVFVGAFHDREVVELAELPEGAVPYGIIPVGARRR